MRPSVREQRQEQLVTEYLRRTPAEREIRRQWFRARDRGFGSLRHRGAWRIRDTKAEPPDLAQIPPSVERLGAWGYRVTEGET